MDVVAAEESVNFHFYAVFMNDNVTSKTVKTVKYFCHLAENCATISSKWLQAVNFVERVLIKFIYKREI